MPPPLLSRWAWASPSRPLPPGQNHSAAGCLTWLLADALLSCPYAGLIDTVFSLLSSVQILCPNRCILYVAARAPSIDPMAAQAWSPSPGANCQFHLLFNLSLLPFS